MTLKSTAAQLKRRGYITEGELSGFRELPRETIMGLLKSRNAFERTAAIRILAQDPSEDLIGAYIDLLVNEKALYTKMALCEAITKYGDAAIPYLVPHLGRIGKNQHKTVRIVDINKKSFPLPTKPRLLLKEIQFYCKRYHLLCMKCPVAQRS